MGYWEDLCESMGLTVAAEWDEVERRLFAGERRCSLFSTPPIVILSEHDRPGDLPVKVAEAFQGSGFDSPREVELLQYTYRFTLPTGAIRCVVRAIRAIFRVLVVQRFRPGAHRDSRGAPIAPCTPLSLGKGRLESPRGTRNAKGVRRSRH